MFNFQDRLSILEYDLSIRKRKLSVLWIDVTLCACFKLISQSRYIYMTISKIKKPSDHTYIIGRLMSSVRTRFDIWLHRLWLGEPANWDKETDFINLTLLEICHVWNFYLKLWTPIVKPCKGSVWFIMWENYR